jgi:hypothetical protein
MKGKQAKVGQICRYICMNYMYSLDPPFRELE